MRYILIGPPDPESTDHLYWSNTWGWGSFEGCTTFPAQILVTPLPTETLAIAEIANNKIGRIYELHPPSSGGA